MRFAVAAIALILTAASCRADALRDEIQAKLAKMTFSSDQQRLTFLRTESQKVEKTIVPLVGASRPLVDQKFGVPDPATDMRGHIRDENTYDYSLTDEAGMEIYYRDNKVHYATIFYASTVKQRPIHMTPDMKEELEDAESEYIASQVLLKRFHPKH